MVDMAVRRVRLLVDLVSLQLDLVMMDMVDLEMMILNWEVAIKIAQDVGERNC